MDSGAHYDPVSDTWYPTTIVDAPIGREEHTAVWVDDRMFVWGGDFGPLSIGDGGSYCGCMGTVFYADGDNDNIGDATVTEPGCTPPSGYVLVGGDCDDADGNVWGTPTEVQDLMFSTTTALAWAAPARPSGTTPLYDVLRTGDPANFVTEAACVTSDSSLTDAVDEDDPLPGGVFFYDVRAETGCPGDGQGPLGSDSNGVPRSGRACP